MYKYILCALVAIMSIWFVLSSNAGVVENKAQLAVPQASANCIAFLTNETDSEAFVKIINHLRRNPNVIFIGSDEYVDENHYLIAVKCTSDKVAVAIKQQVSEHLSIKAFFPAVAVDSDGTVACVTGDAFIKPLDTRRDSYALLAECRDKLEKLGFGNDSSAPIIGNVLFNDLIFRATENRKDFFAEQKRVYEQLKDLPIVIVPLYCNTYTIWKKI